LIINIPNDKLKIMSYFVSRNHSSLKQSKALSNTQDGRQKYSSNKKLNEIKQSLHDDRTNYFQYQNIPSSKTATKSISNVISFAVNSHNGSVRTYNEDRVSIIVNVKNPSPEFIKKWPLVSYFAVFDGHSGSRCADFLKENLHNFVSKRLTIDI
jgi:protein phosphatase 2C family protein 2/3